MSQEHVNLILRVEISLASYPYTSDSVLPVSGEFDWPRADSTLSCENDQASSRDDRHPVEIGGAERNLGQVIMTGVYDIGAPSTMQKLAQA
ncbi:MAG: hypothetical protein M3N46_12645 [Actinomycetota bacterium]|nr:hypothetical protein [Actinomycetota bacterium]